MKEKIIVVLIAVSLLQIAPVSSLDFTGSSIGFDKTAVGSGEVVLVTVTVANSTDPQIANALVILTISSGTFASVGQFDEFANNNASVSGITPTNGTLSVSWIAPEVNTTVPEIVVGFSADISTPYASTLIQNNVTVSVGASDISNSELKAPEAVKPGDNFTITAIVKDVNNLPKSDFDVSFDVSDGNPVETQGGLTNASGMISVLWTAPLLSVDIVNITLNIRAVISASENVNITLSTQTAVVVSSQTTLQVIKPILSQVTEKSDNVLFIGLKLNDTEVAIAGEIDIQVTDGLFYRLNTSYGSIVDENGYISVNWTAPALPDIQPLEVNFRIEARYVNLTVQDSFNITVLPIYGNISLTMTIKDQVYRQDEPILIEFLAIDSDTHNPTGGITIFVTAEFGFFEGSGLNEITVETDLRGEAQVTLNLTEAQLIIELQTVVIYANASKLKYNTDAVTDEVIVQRIIPPSLKMQVTVDENTVLTKGQKLDFIVAVKDLTGQNVPNVTVEISADDGIFPNSNLIFRGSTDSNGVIIITWTANLSSSVPSVSISFRITLLSEQYKDGFQEFHVTVVDSSAQSSSVNIDTAGANKENNALLGIGGAVATVAAAGAGIAVIYKKKN